MIPSWLSRQRCGLYMLTEKKPILQKVGKTEETDLYVPVGDGLGFRHICPWGAEIIWDVKLEPLEMVRVWTVGGKIKPKRQ